MNPGPNLILRNRRLGIFVLWTMLGMFFATKLVMERKLAGIDYPWTKALWWQLMEWYVWALLSLAVFWFCRRTYRAEQRWVPYAIKHLLMGLVLSVTQAVICSVGGLIEAWLRGWPLTPIGTPYSFWVALEFTVVNHLHFNLLVYASLVIAWHAVRHYRDLALRELRAAALETQLARAQLETLKTQLQPHFLFNTLNTIAELIRSEPEGAEQMILGLSELLRSTLKSGEAQEIPLREEITILRKYLEIQQVRLGARLKVHWDLCPETLSARVPSLLLQPIVENAIEHGIAAFSGPGEMKIHSRREDNLLVLQVCDNGPGWNNSTAPLSNKGIGLTNTGSRLRHLYGSNQRLELINDHGLLVRLSLPFTAFPVSE